MAMPIECWSTDLALLDCRPDMDYEIISDKLVDIFNKFKDYPDWTQQSFLAVGSAVESPDFPAFNNDIMVIPISRDLVYDLHKTHGTTKTQLAKLLGISRDSVRRMIKEVEAERQAMVSPSK